MYINFILHKSSQQLTWLHMRLNGRCLKASEHGAQQEQPSADPSRWVDWTELSVLHVTTLAVQYPENTVHGNVLSMHDCK